MIKSIVELLTSRKANLITQVSDFNDLAPAFIVCSALSPPHLKSLAEDVIRLLKNSDFSQISVEGMKECNWVMIDSGEFIVHIFRQEVRDYYEVDKLWNAVPHSFV